MAIDRAEIIRLYKDGKTAREIGLILGCSHALVLQRVRQHGGLMRPNKRRDDRKTVVDRFMRFVSPEPNSGCWLWLGCGDPIGGYGMVTVNRKTKMAHRHSYELFRSVIPNGLEIDHLCRVRCCVNPDHLEPVTPSVNTMRSDHYLRLKRACPKGHPYDEKNTVVNRHGRRNCRTCRYEAARKWRLAQHLRKLILEDS